MIVTKTRVYSLVYPSLVSLTELFFHMKSFIFVWISSSYFSCLCQPKKPHVPFSLPTHTHCLCTPPPKADFLLLSLCSLSLQLFGFNITSSSSSPPAVQLLLFFFPSTAAVQPPSSSSAAASSHPAKIQPKQQLATTTITTAMLYYDYNFCYLTAEAAAIPNKSSPLSLCLAI